MADFAGGIFDQRAGCNVIQAIQGKQVFRRFENRLHENFPHLQAAWDAFQSIWAKRTGGSKEWTSANAAAAAGDVGGVDGPSAATADSLDEFQHSGTERC